MKKIIAFISALTICTSAFSCSKKNDDKTPQQSFSVETLGNVAYKTERLDTPDDMTMIYCVEAFDKCSKYFVVGAGSHGVDFWIANSDFSSFTTVEVPDFDYGANYMLDVADDGTIVTFVNDVSYGDLPDPDPMSEDYNEEEYNAAAEYKFRIMTYSADGTLISNNDVKDYQVLPDELTHITECASDGKIVIVTIDGSTEVFSVDGTYLGEFKANDGETIENFGKNTNGELIAAVRTSEKNIQLRQINEKGEITPSSVTYELSETVYGEIEPGCGDYTMFVRSMTTIYGIRSGDNSIVPLFSINRAGLNSSNFSDFAMCPDGNFVVPVTNYSNWSCKLKKFVPCDPSELENIQTLTVGIANHNWSLEEYVDIFNDENQDYQVSLKIYDSGNVYDHDKITEQIQQDALSGNLPDVVVCDGLDGRMAGFSTIEMDVLCDLYEFMDKDDTLTRDAFVPSVLNHIDYNFDGHAYLLPEEFSIKLPYTAKTEFVKDIKDWDFNAYMDLLESPPEGMADEYKNREERQWDRLHIRFDDYVDFKNISCHFDSPEFIRALKYAYEGKPDNQDDYVSNNEDSDPDAEQRSYSYALRENRELFTNGNISSYTSYIDFTKGTFGGEPITVLGNFGSGKDKAVIETDGTTYGITRTSENKELAWKFIKHMLSDEYYDNYRINDGAYHWGIDFAPTISGMKLVADYEKKPVDHMQPTLKDYDGCAFNTWTKDENGDYIYERLGRVDDDVIAEVDALIASAQPKDQSYIYGAFSDEQANSAYLIFNEEVDRFFHGETSAEECASLIQSRISIYLSEQFD